MTELALERADQRRWLGWYQRLQAKLLSRGGLPYDRLVHAHKQALLAPLRGTIVEVGPGAGPNFQYLTPGVDWIGVEPNPYLHAELEARGERAAIRTEVRPGIAEQLPVDDASADAVICTLVLCSVRDQDAALREIRRVLRPGGTFVFIEHVAARSRWRRLRQHAIRPAWQVLGGGCHPARRTGDAIERAGFTRVERADVDLPIAVIGPHIVGLATR